MPQPDSTAVSAALGRAAHLLLDAPPPVFDDTVGYELVHDATLLRTLGFSLKDGATAGDDWVRDPRAAHLIVWRGTFVGRARVVEDLVDDGGARGVDQYVILGAGIDTFALRRHDLTDRLTVFEVDELGTQEWKIGRLAVLGIRAPANLRFVPVNFESGESWVERIADAGFDPSRPAVITSTGVAQYISREAMKETMRLAAGLAPGTSFATTFVVPTDLIAADERDLRALTEERASARGHPWVSFYSPEEMMSTARTAGFNEVRHVPPDEWFRRYFAGRGDGLRPTSGEHIVVAARR